MTATRKKKIDNFIFDSSTWCLKLFSNNDFACDRYGLLYDLYRGQITHNFTTEILQWMRIHEQEFRYDTKNIQNVNIASNEITTQIIAKWKQNEIDSNHFVIGIIWRTAVDVVIC